MVLIFSKSGDLTTDWVIDWLIHHNHPFLRINASDIYNKNLKIDLINKSFNFGQKRIPLNDINAVWYRKFKINRINQFRNKDIDLNIPFYLDKEYNVILETIFYLLKDKKWLTKPDKATPNKCEMLLKALEAGIKIPDSKIVSSIDDLIELMGNNTKYIFKSIYNSTLIQMKEGNYTTYTELLSSDKINNCKFPSQYMPSLIQKKIDKSFEIRTFYINKQIYSMAIFSQSDTQTEMDFRNYNWAKPNRCVPYKLPNQFERKIRKFMKSIDLNCGSLDFIMGTDKQLYFLEVNPVGQFGMVDIPCNYNLHQKVAEELIRMDTL